ACEHLKTPHADASERNACKDTNMTDPATTRPPPWPPQENLMPDLSALVNKRILTVVVSRFVGGGPSTWTTSALMMNFVRLVDKVIRDYQATRGALEEK